MGLEYTYQSIPDQNTMLAAIQKEPAIGVYLEKCGFKSSISALNDDKIKTSVIDWCRHEASKTRLAHEGIEYRRLELGNRWDILLYLISLNRRNDGMINENEWPYRAVHGGKTLGDAICTAQGIPIRYLPPDEVRDVWRNLEEYKAVSLDLYWDPKEMKKAGVYTIRGTEDRSEVEAVRDDFRALREFFQSAAMYEEGVLSFCG